MWHSLFSQRGDCRTGSYVHLSGMTFPWEVPPETVIVEYIDGLWRVVPHRLPVEIFHTREEAIACAWRIAQQFLKAWRVVEKSPPAEGRRSA